MHSIDVSERGVPHPMHETVLAQDKPSQKSHFQGRSLVFVALLSLMDRRELRLDSRRAMPLYSFCIVFWINEACEHKQTKISVQPKNFVKFIDFIVSISMFFLFMSKNRQWIHVALVCLLIYQLNMESLLCP
jgi:hypothetical protein